MRYYAFVRAINTGNRRITNAAQLAPLVAAGVGSPAAYRAAGNLTFVSDDTRHGDDAELSALLGAAYGFDAPTFVRTGAEIDALLHSCPFTADDPTRIQVTFLSTTPDEDARRRVHVLAGADDRVAIVGREWFWMPEHGVSTSTLRVPAVERVLGPMTMRSLATVAQMYAKFGAH